MRGRKLKKLEIQHIRHGVNFTVGIWILRGLLTCIREIFFFNFHFFRFGKRGLSGERGVDDGGDSGGDLEKGWFDVLCRYLILYVMQCYLVLSG